MQPSPGGAEPAQRRPPAEPVAGEPLAAPDEQPGLTPDTDAQPQPDAEAADIELAEIGSAPDFDEPVLPPVDLDDTGEPPPPPAAVEPRAVARQREAQGNRVAAFLRASWAELQRVQWPDRRQVAQATAVVLGFVVIAGSFLGLADYVSQKIVDAIL